MPRRCRSGQALLSRVDCSKITKVLPEFQPVWDARKGAVELHETYKKIGLVLEDFEGDRVSSELPTSAS